MTTPRLFLLIIAFLGMTGPASAAVLVTIKPVHSIVTAVTDGIEEPDLLLDGTVSVHLDRIKPSVLRSLQDADLVVWVGEGIETLLASAIEQLPDTVRVITLANADLPSQLPLRDSHDHEHLDQHSDDHEFKLDPHLWLDPVNAAAIADIVAETLAELYPTQRQVYLQNAREFKASLANTVETVASHVSDVSDKPYLVFHDSLQYFENRFALNNAGVVTYQPQVAPSARHLKALKQSITDKGINCILTEPQFETSSIKTVVSDASINYRSIDPLASMLPSGVGLYQQWLLDTAIAIRDCLNPPAKTVE